jgi:hypothetical protein
MTKVENKGEISGYFHFGNNHKIRSYETLYSEYTKLLNKGEICK